MLLFESSFDSSDMNKNTVDGGGGGTSRGGLSAVAAAAAASMTSSDEHHQIGRYLVRWVCEQADLWLLLYRCGEILARVHGPLERNAERVEELFQQLGGSDSEFSYNVNNNNNGTLHQPENQQQPPPEEQEPSLAQRWLLPWWHQGIRWYQIYWCSMLIISF